MDLFKSQCLLDYFRARESATDPRHANLDMIARLGVWNEQHETLNSSNAFATPASLLDVDLVLLPFLDWLREGSATTAEPSPFETHAFHLVYVLQEFHARQLGQKLTGLVLRCLLELRQLREK